MSTNLFDFSNPNMLLHKQTKNSLRRVSGTVPETVKHGIAYTPDPGATIHHTIIAACPHPTKELANKGTYYMLAYISIHPDWLELITDEFASTWDVTFIGPAGMIQRLPPLFLDMEDILGNRVYIGFDWLWLGEGAQPIQPRVESIAKRLHEFVSALRSKHEPQLDLNR